MDEIVKEFKKLERTIRSECSSRITTGTLNRLLSLLEAVAREQQTKDANYFTQIAGNKEDDMIKVRKDEFVECCHGKLVTNTLKELL